jgi:hypothetical protein
MSTFKLAMGRRARAIARRARLKHTGEATIAPEEKREEKRVNEQFREACKPENVRRRLNMLPTLYEIELAKLLWPESQALLVLQHRCKRVLQKPDHWQLRVAKKFDRVTFPELTQDAGQSEQERLAGLSPQELIEAMPRSRLDRHKRVARVLAALKVVAPNYPDWRNGLFGSKLAKFIMDAVWSHDDLLLIQFGKALATDSRARCSKARVYSYLLRNAEAVERCNSKAEIMRLPGFPKYDEQTRYKLFDEVGLPVKKS